MCRRTEEEVVGLTVGGPGGLSRECVLRIPMRVVKGDYNWALIRR